MSQQNYAKPNPWMISTLILLGVVVGFGASQIPYFKGEQAQVATLPDSPTQPKAQEPTATPPAVVLTDEQIQKLPDDDTIIGQANAPITLVEFSDFQCPYCARFFKNTFSLIEESYIKTGKVRFIYRDFPLESHPQAEPAAEAAECADEQGKFKEMHDAIFSGQSEWSGNAEAVSVFKSYAKTIRLDTKKFNECMDKHTYQVEVRKDLVDGATMGVNGTPGFFVNGKEISGAMPYEEVFKPVFEAELAGKKWELQFDPLGNPSVKVFE